MVMEARGCQEYALVPESVKGADLTDPSPQLALVLGGARSGKSRHAEGLITARPPPWVYVATAAAHDEEMRERIALHQARRDGGWRTVEAPLALGEALDRAAAAPVLVDCLTLWLANLLLGEHDVEAATQALERALERRAGLTVLVASEVGLGIVPEHALARRFRDAAGSLHQRLAARADHVVLVAAGLPLTLKGSR